MRRQAGFTLVELVLVIVILGVIAVYAAPRFDRDAFDAAAAADELTEAIRYTQEMAMSHSGQDDDGDGNLDNYRITISTSGYTVTLVDSNSSANVRNPETKAASYTESWSGISLSPATTINFDSRGRPDLSADATITLTSGGDSATVVVEQTTGFAR
jgi:MSHA pilin protein MshC